MSYITQADIDAFITSVLAEADTILQKRDGVTLADATADCPVGWKWRVLRAIQQWYGYDPNTSAWTLVFLLEKAAA